MPIFRRKPDPLNEVAVLRERLREESAQTGLLTENLLALELAITGDPEWRRIGHAMEMEFSRAGLNNMVNASRAMYLANPLINRAINVTTYYTWAQGYQFKAAEDQIQEEVVDVTTDNEGNKIEIYGHQAMMLTDIEQMTDGNVFLVLFTDDLGNVQLRSFPQEEIVEIIPTPEDRNRVMFYRRRWAQLEWNPDTASQEVKSYECFYPDISWMPVNQPDKMGGYDVHWDSPVMHQRTGGLKRMQFGIPQTYAALDWARAHKKFLEDWHTLVSSLARFAWTSSTKGSKLDRVKGLLNRKSAAAGAGELEDPPANPDDRAPVPGSVWAGTETDKLAPINKTGATPAADDAKQSRLMVASAMDLPDTILSNDPQQGALATAQTLDRPTELGLRSRQEMYRQWNQRIFRYIVDAKVLRGQLPGKVTRDYDGQKIVEPRIDPAVEMMFPPILEHDQLTTVQSIVAAATLSGNTPAQTLPSEELSKLLMSALGVEDVQEALDQLDQEQQQEMEQTIKDLTDKLAQQQQGDPTPPPGQQQPAAGANGATP